MMILMPIYLRWAGSAHISGAPVSLVRPLEASMGLAHESLHRPGLDRFQWQSAPASHRARSRGQGKTGAMGRVGGGGGGCGAVPWAQAHGAFT